MHWAAGLAVIVTLIGIAAVLRWMPGKADATHGQVSPLSEQADAAGADGAAGAACAG